jgi:hypothetical protein
MLVYRRVVTAGLMVMGMASLGGVTAQEHPGVKVYAAQKCSICHSIAGAGNKKLPLDGVGAKLTEDQNRRARRSRQEDQLHHQAADEGLHRPAQA